MLDNYVNNISVGDIMVAYSGCEHWFYKVLKVNPKSLKVRLLEREHISEDRVRPTANFYDWSEVETAKIKTFDDGQRIVFAPHSKDWLGMFDETYNYFF